MFKTWKSILPEHEKTLPIGKGESLTYWEISGREEGPSLLLVSGVHGAEYVGPLCLRHLYGELSSGEFRGRVVILPLANPNGFYEGRKEVVPSDGINLNRAFPPAETDDESARIARAVKKHLYPKADFLLDLHSGEIYETMVPLVFFPVGSGEEIAKKTREAAKHILVDWRLPSTASNGLYSHATHCGIPGMIVEIGCGGRWTEELVSLEVASVKNLMAHLGMMGTPLENTEQREATKTHYFEADADGCWFPEVIDEEVVEEGSILGHLVSYEGEILQILRAPFRGQSLYHSHSLGVRKGSPLVTFVSDEDAI